MSKTFDANHRLAELALWLNDGSRWLDRATTPADAATPRTRRTVHIAFDRAELETFAAGLRGVARSLMGLAQPVPPFFGTSPLARRHLHLVE
jgi:hypothetical protein